MKKLLFYLIIITAVSCKKDGEKKSIYEPIPVNSQLTIENARKILNSDKNQNKIHLVNPSEKITEKIKTKVSWADAVQYVSNGLDVVEVPYKMDTLVVRDYAASSLPRKFSKTLSDFVQSNLIIYKKRTDSLVTMEVVKYIPNEESFNNPFYKIHSLSLNNLGEWTGYIEYSHTNGELFYISKVTNGTVVNVKAATLKKSSNRGDMSIQSGPCVV
ncbi:hypothetical protein EV200_11191 [Pedobacter psychrotolerans]|uniref:Uncharacterized protein n=1 Tax=Pedobacter psychrotolerans TaxID=1843235 RepID=A0A4R2H3C6_9SPHI|nr:hypothetical protein [Pedobacter psychrotolerans]TCO18753.1 hypothetical protein EV200_11191 [Pedobacter psychrotolerans]GGE70478.1 hypothetical protein GCM10011413_41480 [Pedobacter psychrotolerans]